MAIQMCVRNGAYERQVRSLRQADDLEQPRALPLVPHQPIILLLRSMLDCLRFSLQDKRLPMLRHITEIQSIIDNVGMTSKMNHLSVLEGGYIFKFI